MSLAHRGSPLPQGDALHNCNVEGFQHFNITLPQSCMHTTPIQLAVSLSHLKVSSKTLYHGMCKHCHIRSHLVLKCLPACSACTLSNLPAPVPLQVMCV